MPTPKDPNASVRSMSDKELRDARNDLNSPLKASDRDLDSRRRAIDLELQRRGKPAPAPSKAAQAAQSDAAKTAAAAIGRSAMSQAARRTGQATRRYDAGAVKRNQEAIRYQFGIGDMVNVHLLDPIYQVEGDPSSPIIGYRNNPQYDNTKFGPWNNTGAWGAAGGGVKDLSQMTGMSPKQMADFYMSLTPDELKRVQAQMFAAGLYGDSAKPNWGFRDDATGRAFTSLILNWADRPDSTLAEVMGDLTRNQSAVLDAEARKNAGLGTAEDLARTQEIQVSSADSLNSVLDSVAMELFGETLDPGVKEGLIAKLQDQERQSQKASAQISYANQVRASGSGGNSEMDAFIFALTGQESGGDPTAVNARTGASGLGQIMPDNWPNWSREAGVDPTDFSAANQMKVIRYKVGQMYAAYGNWRDVAIAWYSGQPSTYWSSSTLNAPQGYGDEPSMNEYASQLLARMTEHSGQQLADGGTAGLTFEETVDPGSAKDRATAQLMAMDPNRYWGTKLFRSANNFFDLLKSPVSLRGNA